MCKYIYICKFIYIYKNVTAYIVALLHWSSKNQFASYCTDVGPALLIEFKRQKLLTEIIYWKGKMYLLFQFEQRNECASLAIFCYISWTHPCLSWNYRKTKVGTGLCSEQVQLDQVAQGCGHVRIHGVQGQRFHKQTVHLIPYSATPVVKIKLLVSNQ